MTATTKARIDVAIRAAYPLPDRTARLRRLATYDLWYGPLQRDGLDDADLAVWSGFSAAIAELRAWAESDMPSTLYYDDDCGYLSDTEPRGVMDGEEWIEPSEYYQVERREIWSALFPSLLYEYI